MLHTETHTLIWRLEASLSPNLDAISAYAFLYAAFFSFTLIRALAAFLWAPKANATLAIECLHILYLRTSMHRIDRQLISWLTLEVIQEDRDRTLE